jgi:hypothetical protein
MPRIYKVSFSNVLVAAAQDLVLVTGATGKLMKILRHNIACSNVSLAVGQNLSLRSRFLPATVTVGSGGTTGITPSKTDPGDAVCSSTTCGTNNTTQSTTNGTAIVLYTGGCHLYNGELHRYDCPPPIGPSEAFVFELLNVLSGTVNLSGWVEFSEEGG